MENIQGLHDKQRKHPAAAQDNECFNVFSSASACQLDRQKGLRQGQQKQKEKKEATIIRSCARHYAASLLLSALL